MKGHQFSHPLILLVLMVGMVLAVACQPLSPISSVAVPTATAVAEEVEAAVETEEALSEDADAPAVDVTALVAAANPPVQIDIPSLTLKIPVAPMGWESAVVDGKRTTRWVVPDDAAGWALNSAGAGDAGNIVIAGHQARGAAVFEAIAMGEVETGQEILLADAAGNTFTYRVVEVSEPIALIGATAQDTAQAAAYAATTADARLTLVTGWPSATTTHRIFVVAELAADAE
jgi:LPXTG-site transpeptidase (sortase) family protein